MVDERTQDIVTVTKIMKDMLTIVEALDSINTHIGNLNFDDVETYITALGVKRDIIVELTHLAKTVYATSNLNVSDVDFASVVPFSGDITKL